MIREKRRLKRVFEDTMFDVWNRSIRFKRKIRSMCTP